MTGSHKPGLTNSAEAFERFEDAIYLDSYASVALSGVGGVQHLQAGDCGLTVHVPNLEVPGLNKVLPISDGM